MSDVVPASRADGVAHAPATLRRLDTRANSGRQLLQR